MKISSSFDWMSEELELLKQNHLYRQFRVLENFKTTHAALNGREVILFCGNDYLGLSRHPKLIQAAGQVTSEYGVGTGSARLISGTTSWHASLENRIAKFLGKEAALVFSSGYLANLGVLTTLVKKDDLILLDKLSHASLIDAAQYSEGKLRIFPHGNLEYLEKLLKNSPHPDLPPQGGKERSRSISSPLMGEDKGGGVEGKRMLEPRTWIVTDSIFSMDGDLAELPKLVELKNRYGAYLILDEAHGTGVFGKHGKGVSEHFNAMDEVDVHIGTLSKAVGSFGGFVAGKKELIDYLINHARPFIFETALPPALCQAAICGLDLIDTEPNLRERLWNNTRSLRSGLNQIGAPVLPGDSPIVPVVLGDEKRTLEASQRLLEKGFLIPPVRYPTVAKGKARLRITVSAAHTEDEIHQLISQCLPKSL